MKTIIAYESMDPRRAFGKMTWNEVAHTLLANDYKAPPICLIVYEEDDTDQHDAGRTLLRD